MKTRSKTRKQKEIEQIEENQEENRGTALNSVSEIIEDQKNENNSVNIKNEKQCGKQEGDSKADSEVIDDLSSDVEEVKNKETINSDGIRKNNESDSDEAPEGISLKTSKQIAQENLRKQMTSVLHMKEKRKEKIQEREERNKEQQKRKKSLVPEKLDEQLLKLVDKQIDVEDELRVSLPTKQNEKIYFSDDNDTNKDEGFADEIDDEMKEESVGITAQCLLDVGKSLNENAQHFLKNHFYGDRIKRESVTNTSKRDKRTKKMKSTGDVPDWLKKRNKRN